MTLKFWRERLASEPARTNQSNASSSLFPKPTHCGNQVLTLQAQIASPQQAHPHCFSEPGYGGGQRDNDHATCARRLNVPKLEERHTAVSAGSNPARIAPCSENPWTEPTVGRILEPRILLQDQSKKPDGIALLVPEGGGNPSSPSSDAAQGDPEHVTSEVETPSRVVLTVLTANLWRELPIASKLTKNTVLRRRRRKQKNWTLRHGPTTVIFENRGCIFAVMLLTNPADWSCHAVDQRDRRRHVYWGHENIKVKNWQLCRVISTSATPTLLVASKKIIIRDFKRRVFTEEEIARR